MQNFTQNIDYVDADQEITKDDSSNPLQMVKEYKSQQPKANMGGKQSASAYGSNASTGAYMLNDEQDRMNRIMHEPIENLLSNMNNLSRPVSSVHNLNLVRGGRKVPPYRSKKKERAMTAVNEKGMLGRGQGAPKIAESAYHIGRQRYLLN